MSLLVSLQRVPPSFPPEYAKSSSFCNSTTTANIAQQNGYVICSCKPGFIGNGQDCTRMAFCDTFQCCPPGYNWDVNRKSCVDINECSSSTLHKCSPTETCINRNGIYLCVASPTALCNGATCSKDQDCIKTKNGYQCVDPCDWYDILNGDSRLFSIDSSGRFSTDRYNFGWFRYTGRSTNSLKVGPVSPLQCGSLEPYSIDGTHPNIGDGIQRMTLLSNTLSGTIKAGTVPVKACPRGYYVYKFSGMLKFDVYCTGEASVHLLLL
ncbi:uromodulin-like [Hyla sarda]|uniref:uromodulin-like n=1 Tax=Hyla sarda TaxID=327740 RepID=UPI0024C25858|nr:uromodulin-like [Hyla sarda]